MSAVTFDDPQKPEFVSWRSYHLFARHVRQARRHIPDEQTRSFLDTVLASPHHCGPENRPAGSVGQAQSS